MNIQGVEELDLWSQEAMIYYLMFLVIGAIVTSHITEALYIIFNRAEDNERALAKQRFKRSTKRLRELTNDLATSRHRVDGILSHRRPTLVVPSEPPSSAAGYLASPRTQGLHTTLRRNAGQPRVGPGGSRYTTVAVVQETTPAVQLREDHQEGRVESPS